jgi:hypothetical protein
MKGSVATTARDGKCQIFLLKVQKGFVLAYTVIHNKLAKFQDHVIAVIGAKHVIETLQQ